MNQLIDLHTHSNYSDGDYSPETLYKIAEANNISNLSLTDHDTLIGNQEILNIPNKKINYITGIELTAKINPGKMHILGYNIDLNNKPLIKALDEIKNNSIEDTLRVLFQVGHDFNITFPQCEMNKLTNSLGNIGRPALSRLCVKYGHASHSQEAFDKYLTPAYEKTRGTNKTPEPEECISLINNAGGTASMAHPYSLKLKDKELLLLLKRYLNLGLQGVEVFNSAHNLEQTKTYYNLAMELGLLISGGTDYHGSFIHPDVEIGTGKNNNIKIKNLSIINHINQKKNAS